MLHIHDNGTNLAQQTTLLGLYNTPGITLGVSAPHFVCVEGPLKPPGSAASAEILTFTKYKLNK